VSETLFSPSWYRVKTLRPRLKAHARVHRHTYRGQVWFVLQDPVSGRHHRFNPVANAIIGLMDGQRTLQEIWEAAGERFGDDMPTQDEMIQLLAQLHQADVLQSGVNPDMAELLRRHEAIQVRQRRQKMSSPLALKIPVYDPDRLVARLVPFVRPLMGWAGFLLWAAVVGSGIALAVMNWPALTANVADRVLAADNLLLLWLTFPIVKALHELGHAVTTKAWGGEVHEIGIMFLVLMPVPYVDASAASAFAERRQRMVVGAAGMMVELFVASLAMYLWLALEPGIARAAAFNAMLIAGVSTLLFNANPLLRYDGYYILADYLEIPNLAQRANGYLAYLLRKYVFRTGKAESPVDAPGERGWFLFYSVASFFYRIFVLLAIVLFVAGKYFVIGVVLAGWAVATMFVLPLWRSISRVLFGAEFGAVRRRAVAGMLAGTAVVVLAVVSVPLPLWTRAEGVVRIPEESWVRSGSGGFVEQVLVANSEPVKAGQPLAVCSDPELLIQRKALEARLAQEEVHYHAALVEDRARASRARETVAQVQAQLDDVRRRINDLVVRAPADGTFVIANAADLPGRYLKRGALLGYVLTGQPLVARVVVRQDDVDLVRERTARVEMKLAGHAADTIVGRVVREVPAATDTLPSRALGLEGGGTIALDPRDPHRNKALESLFEFDVALPATAGPARLGQRVHVRFDHGAAPLAWQVYRRVRLLFLSKFYV